MFWNLESGYLDIWNHYGDFFYFKPVLRRIAITSSLFKKRFFQKCMCEQTELFWSACMVSHSPHHHKPGVFMRPNFSTRWQSNIIMPRWQNRAERVWGICRSTVRLSRELCKFVIGSKFELLGLHFMISSSNGKRYMLDVRLKSMCIVCSVQCVACSVWSLPVASVLGLELWMARRLGLVNEGYWPSESSAGICDRSCMLKLLRRSLMAPCPYGNTVTWCGSVTERSQLSQCISEHFPKPADAWKQTQSVKTRIQTVEVQ